jgi:hypothetical protein
VKDLADTDPARRIMENFAARTGLSPDGPQRRYLWTDAFALCNYLTLLRRTEETQYRDLAFLLIDRVHHELGRHRADDSRQGWISGLDEEEGERHPTAGGLRIGKELNERLPGEPYDPRAEWDRDGQYFHYLVKWMHALARAAEVLEEPSFHTSAVELARAAHAAFTYRPTPSAVPRMYWKMSVDLSRPLVPSQGAHDPLDGFVTLSALGADRLLPEIEELERMCQPATWATDDPLGVGGLLTDAWWVAQLLATPDAENGRLEPLLLQIMESSLVSLQALARTQPFRRPFEHRLAFRELGLAIGLRALEALLGSGTLEESGFEPSGTRWLEGHVPLADEIATGWSSSVAQATSTWQAHEDINAVMLATALVPGEFIHV